MVDKIKPLKIEDSGSGTETDYLPTETDPSEDYVACKGIAFENSETEQIWKDGDNIKFKDTNAGTKTLTELSLKDIDGGSSSAAYLSSQAIDGGNSSSATNLIQVRRATAANFTSDNPTLGQGEIGLETDTKKIKIGDGSTAWTSLSYIDASYLHTNVAGEINSISEKVTPIDADLIVIEDSADSNNKKKVQLGNLFAGSDTNAIHDNQASEISAITEKVTPIDADLIIIEDSADSNNKKKVQLGNILSSSIFGFGYGYSESLSEQTTTSSVYTSLTTHTNSNPNVGETYIVMVTGEFKSDGSCTCQIKANQQSGATLLEQENATSNYQTFAAEMEVSTFFLGKVQIPITFRRSAGTGTVYVRNIRARSYRVS